jgi:serine/threonine-protein kinase HipA
VNTRPGGVLNVFLGREPVGTLERRGPTRYRFSFAETVLSKHHVGRVVLSASLPLRDESFSPGESAPFFEGLLPEGPMRTTIARALRLNEQDGFAMLEALGADCAGAVTILADGLEPRPPGASRVRSLTEDELVRLIDELPRNPLGVSAGKKGVRLSLGGLQHKLVLCADQRDGLAQPLEGTPSTHILKPESAQYEDLVCNEAFCMRVAGAAGHEVADVKITEVGSTRCLLIQRFDRERGVDAGVVRLHQEDMCQALGILPTAKYEESGGPTSVQIIELIRGIGNQRFAVDIRNFLQAQVLNFLLGNSDAHGKNFALLYHPGSGIRLAPLYDLVSTAVYPDLTDQMAMSVGGIDDPNQIDLRAWSRLADEAGLGTAIVGVVRRQAQAVMRAAGTVAESAQRDGWHRPVIDAIVDGCRERAGRLIDG